MSNKIKSDKKGSKTLQMTAMPSDKLTLAPNDQLKIDHFDKLMSATRDAIIVLRRAYRYSLPQEVDRLQDVVERVDKVKFYSDHADILKGYDNPFANFKPY